MLAPTSGSIRVVLSPLHSAFMLVTDALFGVTTVAPGVQAHLVRRIADAAPVESAFGPVVRSRFRSVPDVVLPSVHDGDPTVDDHLDQLASARHTVTAGFEAEAEGGDDLPEPWQPVAANPDPWLEAMSRFSRAAWEVFAPLWSSAGPLLEHEVARIGSAVVRGPADDVVNTLSPRVRLADDALTLDGRPETCTPLRGRDLVLIPMLAGEMTVVLQRDLPGVVQLGYPLSGGSAVVAGSAAARSAAAESAGVATAGWPALATGTLAGLIGERRAAILQHLELPRSMGELATRLGVSPATITHHCDHLEAAGLVRRVRAGRSVVVGRSARGAAIVEAFRVPAG